jgi:hypothetical protein
MAKDDEKRNLPERYTPPPPPAPPHRDPGGVISSGFSGWASKMRAFAFGTYADEYTAVGRAIEAKTDVYKKAGDLQRAIDEFADIDNTLEEEQRGRDQGRWNNERERERIRVQADLDAQALAARAEELEHQKWVDARRREKEKEHADIATETSQLANRRALSRATADLIIQETRTATLERIKQLSIKTAEHTATQEEAAAHEKSLDAEYRRLRALDEFNQRTTGASKPSAPDFDAIVVLKDQINLIKQRNSASPELETLYALLGRFLAEAEATNKAS